VVCDYTTLGQYQLVVPFGVERLAVLAIGGAGGRSVSADGGYGAQVTDYLEVEEGLLLFINVGQAAYGTGCRDGQAQCQGGYGEGGFSWTGGGGGGASDVRTESASQQGSQSSRLIVAGGGGGAGGSGGPAGGAGGNAGAAGAAGAGSSSGQGGTPGTQTDAGIGGAPNGTDGFLDKGGTNFGNGGGGAGGYYGGGSGGASAGGGGGGGGGSSLVAHGTASVTTATQRTGRVQIRYAVEDHVKPVINLVVPSTEEATSGAGATVSYSAQASDDVDGSVPVSCNPASGTIFALGTQTVSCQAVDVSGNVGTASATVRIVDTTGPTVTVPALIEKEATGPGGAAVSYTATATDTVSGSLTPTCLPPSGSTFGITTTNVTCTATDAAGNTGSATFDVTVGDATQPVVTVPDPIETDATGPDGAVVTFTATASDTVSGSLTATCTPASGSTFGFTTTSVTCTATDAAGNTGTGSFTVTVTDRTKPVLTLPAPITVAATSASGAVVPFTTTAVDAVDGSRPVTCSKASGTVFPVGTTMVTCTSSDTRGNTASGTFSVTVEPWQANLKVTVIGPASVIRGGTPTYHVTVTNIGPSAATNVRTVLTASGLSVIATSPSTGSGSVKVQGVTYTGALWTTATIPVNGSVSFTLTGTVTAKKGDTVIAQGATGSDVPDPATADNVARVTSIVPR
jgi:hypothetical protein